MERRKSSVVFLLVSIVAIVSVYFYIQYKSTHITTDDAFIEGDIYTIASKVQLVNFVMMTDINGDDFIPGHDKGNDDPVCVVY